MIVNAITSFLGMLIEQVMKPVREFLADTLLSTPDVTRHADIRKLWSVMLGITAGTYVLFVTAGGITVMGYETVQTRYTLQQVLPRLLLGMAAAATSLTVTGKVIGLSNALAHAILATDMSDAGRGMVERVLPFALFGAPGLKLYLLVLAIVMVALVLAVLIGFFVRVAVMALLVCCAPLMLACHAHPLTDPVARLWWRGLAGCLVIQIAQSITFVLALKLFYAPGATALGIPKSDQLGTMLAGLALFWVLFKIPGWTLQVVLRGTPVHHPGAPSGVRVLKHMVMYRLMGNYLPGVALSRRSGGPGRAGGGGHGRGRGGPGGGGRTPPGRGGAGPAGGRPPAGPGRGVARGGSPGSAVHGQGTSSGPGKRRGGKTAGHAGSSPGPGKRWSSGWPGSALTGGPGVAVRPGQSSLRSGPRAVPLTPARRGPGVRVRRGSVADGARRPVSSLTALPTATGRAEQPRTVPPSFPTAPEATPTPRPFSTPPRTTRLAPAHRTEPSALLRRARARSPRPAQLRLPLERPWR